MEIPSDISSLVLLTLILGMGYLGLVIRRKIIKKPLSDLHVFDKTVQSVLFGMISFLMVTRTGILSLENMESTLATSILSNPFILGIQFFFLLFLVFFILGLEELLDKILLARKDYQSPS